MTITRAPRTLAILAGAILAGALTGCSTGAEPADEPEPGTEEPSEAPVDSEEPSEEPSEMPGADPADPGTWIIADGRIGPIEIGADFSETLGALPDDWVNDEQCPYMAYWNAPEGTYLVSFRHDEMSDDGSVVAATVETWETEQAGPQTADGLGVGSTRDDVAAVHPDAEEVPAPIGGGIFLAVAAGDPDDGALFFEFAEDGDTVTTVTVTTDDVPAYEPCA
ncbi:hypothetical protein [Microbacterium karelineae]|uniref:hypothetical protein n=1 Tax=Microbacterium karelineae TaxID=2654283 RepID=UPI0012EA1B0B|nr:hypothetical protein [Microbacterium karelineae]